MTSFTLFLSAAFLVLPYCFCPVNYGECTGLYQETGDTATVTIFCDGKTVDRHSTLPGTAYI